MGSTPIQDAMKIKPIKKMHGLEFFPEIPRTVLGGVAMELMALDSQQRAVFHSDVNNRSVLPIPDGFIPTYGFYLKRGKVEIMQVMLRAGRIDASYHWPNRKMPERPVPDRPGYVYPARSYSDCGRWWARIDDDPADFQRWTEQCINHVRTRIDYLVERRRAVVAQREFRADQARIAKECYERWRTRREQIEANMYYI